MGDRTGRAGSIGISGFFAIAAMTAGLAAPVGAVPSSGSAGGGAGFAGPFNFNVGSIPWLVDSGDINRDGRPDIVTANAASATLNGISLPGLGGISVLLNNTPDGAGTPNFAPETHFAAGVVPTGVDVADLDGDGAAELIAANLGDIGPNGVSVLRNTTPVGSAVASFDGPVNFASGAFPTLVRAVDVNSDGLLDLATADAGFPLSAGISVLLNTTAPGGPLSFSAPEQFLGGIVAEGLTIGDINGDGRDDVLVGNTGSSNVAVLVNTTPPGAIRPAFNLSEEWVVTATGIELGDIDADGRLDLVSARTAGGISVRLNRTAPGAPYAEFGGDVGSDLLGEITDAFGTGGVVCEGVTLADFDGDGVVDIAANNDFPLPGYDVAVFSNRTAPGAARPVLVGPEGYRASGWFIGTNSITSADFNGDGKADIATGNVPSLTVGDVSIIPGGVSVLINTRP